MVLFQMVAHYDGSNLLLNIFEEMCAHNMNLFFRQSVKWTPKLQECDCFSVFVIVMGADADILL